MQNHNFNHLKLTQEEVEVFNWLNDQLAEKQPCSLKVLTPIKLASFEANLLEEDGQESNPPGHSIQKGDSE